MSAPIDSRNRPTNEGPLRQRWFLVSALFLVVVVLLGLLVVITTGDDGSDTQAKNPAASPSSPASAPPAATGSCPALKDTDATVPSAAPQGVEWTLFHTVALPSSEASGPAASDGDLRRCFAHTPTGALLAAAQISTRSMLAANWQQVWKRQTYGDAKEAQLKELTKQFGTAPLPQPEAGELGQFAGFHFITYSTDVAVIDLLTRFSDGSLRVNTASLRWNGGDWQYEVSATAQQRAVSSPEGFTSWGGV
ncbi:hypothetical protein [Streptomyces pseudovenezuelae]|uniref:hypothetical protein n=1 Tax=Streptomyces pseudovenezuelae TaxID=67350 RepID=UPI0036EB997F